MHSTIRRALFAGLLLPFGTAPVYRDSRTGELLVDTDAVRRSGGPRVPETGFEFGYDDDDEDDDDEFEDDFDDDDFGYDEDDDDFGYDDDEDDFGYEFGGRGRDRRRSRRADRKENRVERLEKQIAKLRGESSRGASSRRQRSRRSSVSGWARTIVSGSDELAAAGTAKVAIRLQHHFKAKDITFAGSPVGTTITSIHFGDRLIFSDANGVDASVFGTQSFLRSLLEGQNLRAGLDITIAGELNAAGTLKVAVTGFKPKG
jgi:hypothetical protein